VEFYPSKNIPWQRNYAADWWIFIIVEFGSSFAALFSI